MENFKLGKSSILESLNILINQCWKTLPIFEGKKLNNTELYTREKAYENYQKHIDFLATKVSGASKFCEDNGHYIELLYLINGMKDIEIDNHDKVKYITNHCISLIKHIKEDLRNG